MSKNNYQWPSTANVSDLFRAVANSIDAAVKTESCNGAAAEAEAGGALSTETATAAEKQKAEERAEKLRLASGKILEIFGDKWAKDEGYDMIGPYQHAVESALTKFDTVESFIMAAEEEAISDIGNADNIAVSYGDCYVEGYKRYYAVIAEECLLDLEEMRKAIRENQDIAAAETHVLVVKHILDPLLKQKNTEYTDRLDQTLLSFEDIGLVKGKNGVNDVYFPAYNKVTNALETGEDGIAVEKLMETPVCQNRGETGMTYKGYVRMVAENSLSSQQLAKLKQKLEQERGENSERAGRLWLTHHAKIGAMVGDSRTKTMKGRIGM